MKRKQLRGVPPQAVGEVIQAFVEEGFARVTCSLRDDGTWTVTASQPRTGGA